MQKEEGQEKLRTPWVAGSHCDPTGLPYEPGAQWGGEGVSPEPGGLPLLLLGSQNPPARVVAEFRSPPSPKERIANFCIRPKERQNMTGGRGLPLPPPGTGIHNCLASAQFFLLEGTRAFPSLKQLSLQKPPPSTAL